MPGAKRARVEGAGRIGSQVEKDFGGELFAGTVVGYKKPYYKIKYEDDDVEEVTLKELEQLLVPAKEGAESCSSAEDGVAPIFKKRKARTSSPATEGGATGTAGTAPSKTKAGKKARVVTEAEDDETTATAAATAAAAAQGSPKAKGNKKAKVVTESPTESEVDGEASEETPEPAKGGTYDVGAEVKARDEKTGKWYKGVVVKLTRAGVTEKYRIKGVECVMDNGRGVLKAPIDDNPDLVLTGVMREVRYWSSGTPCMRSSGFDHAKPTTEESTSAAESRGRSKKRGVVKYQGTTMQRLALSKSEDKAKEIWAGLEEGEHPTKEQILEMLTVMGDDWPTQVRHNVTNNKGGEVPGMCMGAVCVLGGVGMEVSNVSQAYPTVCKVLTRWVRGSLPESNYPFSSLQVNYNYQAKRHVDGNNIGPSYIISLGDHAGGELWTADKYIEGEGLDGSKVMRGGGGEGLLQCRNDWKLFNGNAEHETRDIRPLPGKKKQLRISFIVFSHHSYNKLPKAVADDLIDLGFTAAGSDGVDLPYFRRYRIDKKEFDANENNSYFDYQAERAVEKPPPSQHMRVAIECYGLTMARGGGWMSFHAGDAAAAAASSSSSSSAAAAAAPSASDPTVIELKPNMTGFHVLELKPSNNGRSLELASQHTDRDRFNIYKDTDKETRRFAKWVDALPNGRVVMICITDTAIAAKRPPGKLLYDTLVKLGASSKMERIGYRFPFAMIGVKGAKEGSANLAMDKTKVLLRLEANVNVKAGKTVLEDKTEERVNVTELILAAEQQAQQS